MQAIIAIAGAVSVIGGIVMWWLRNYKSIPAKIAKLEKARDEKFEEYKNAVHSNSPNHYQLLAERDKLCAEIARLRQRQRAGLLSRFQ